MGRNHYNVAGRFLADQVTTNNGRYQHVTSEGVFNIEQITKITSSLSIFAVSLPTNLLFSDLSTRTRSLKTLPCIGTM